MSQQNSYRNFIDITTKEGQALVANAIDKFTSPLTGDDLISLNGSHFQKVKDNIFRLGSRFGYDSLFKCVTTVQTTDSDGNVTYSNPINMLERYSDDTVELAQKHASFNWGDSTFTVNAMNLIRELTQADGFLEDTGALTNDGKDLVLERMHSKFLGYHILEILTDSAYQAIEQQSSIYTWNAVDRFDEEIDGLTILALVLTRIRPNFKVRKCGRVEGY
jgi:hypothetical protein